MSGTPINDFSSFQVFPKYVSDETLKRARVETEGGTSIRVTATNPEPTPADLSTLESTTADIKTASQAISDKVGFRNEAAWDGEAASASVIQIEKKTSGDTASIKTAVGSTTDADTDSTAIGLLKKISTNTVDLSTVSTPLGTTADTSSDSTVIGLLKSISSKLQ